MPYQKPGIEISQVQKSQSPILTTPELTACLVGHPYWWQDPSWDNASDPLRNSIASVTYSGVAVTFAISGVNSQYYDVTAVPELTIVDLLGITGTNTGKLFNLQYTTGFTVATNQITVLASASAYDTSTGLATTLTNSTGTYQIKIGFRANMTIGSGYNDIASFSDIKNTLGEPVSYNPLAFGAATAINNSNSAISVLGISPSVITDGPIKSLIDDNLELKEVYVIAPMLQQLTASSMKAHVENLSTATAKKERIGLVNPAVAYGADATTLSTSSKTTLAALIRDNTSVIQSKRVFAIHPDAAYVLERRHISTVKPYWIKKSFSLDAPSVDFENYGPFALLTSDVSLPTGLRYKAGTKITTAVFTDLLRYGITDSKGYLTVLAPVPGFYYSAQTAGQIISKEPQAPLTNVPGTGLDRTFGSQDLFSETLLNTIASGGVYIMTQNTVGGPIFSRHQKSTDVTSVAKAEMSVTIAIDYTAKFIRNALLPYIGRNNITPEFIALVNAVLQGVALTLKRNGVLKDLKINSVVQDTVSPDTLNIELEALPFYPANYIKITLLF